MSVLALLKTLREQHPRWTFLLTTGTVTSARIIASRLPEGVFHQYVPVDRWPYVTRFLDHWRPDIALWVESELWPNMLDALNERAVPTLLLNGRMSEKSFRRWSLVKPWIRRMMATFTLGLAQTETERDRFAALGLRDSRFVGNLKYAAAPLPYDEAEYARLKQALGSRKIWLMASTHPGEDDIALSVHQKLRQRWPDLLTIIVPRHPARAEAVAALIAQRGMKGAQRSLEHPLTADTSVYLADSMGEMGLFYRLCPVVGLGGTFTWGGHNPLEPAQLGCALVFGPRMTNFQAIAADLLAANAAIQVQTPEDFIAALARLLDNSSLVAALSEAERRTMAHKQDILRDTLAVLGPVFNAEQVSMGCD